MILTDADELRAALRQALEKRDEARAALRTVAERQRWACAKSVEALVSGPASTPYFVPLDRFMAMGQAAEAALSTALVTDTKADGGAP